MTKLDQLQLQVRGLVKRLEALEAAAAARPARRRRERAPRPADIVIAARQRLWARLVLLHLQYGHGRMTKLKFAVKYRLGDPSDFCRFLSTADKRGIAESSATAVRYYQALKEAIAELETRRDTHRQHFHGNMAPLQDSSARPH